MNENTEQRTERKFKELILNSPPFIENSRSPIFFSFDRAPVPVSNRKKLKIIPVSKNSEEKIISGFGKENKKKGNKLELKKKNSNFFKEVIDFDSESEMDNKKICLEIKNLNYRPKITFIKQSSFFEKIIDENCFSLSNFLNLEKHKSVLEAQKLKKTYTCKYCGETFNSGCAMGGHISKIHSGLSQRYKKKLFKGKYRKNEKERNHYLRNIFKNKNVNKIN